MYFSTEVKKMAEMDIKARAFNSIASILEDTGYDVWECLGNIIDVIDDAIAEIDETKQGMEMINDLAE